MLSRLFWIGIAGIALVTGMVLQDGHRIFSWADDRTTDSRIDRAVDSGIDRVVDRSFDNMQVVGSDGREIDVPPEAKRALGDAIGSLVKAETELALLRIGDGNSQEMEAAQAARDHARANVDRLKAQIERQGQAPTAERDVIREQIRSEIREDIRETVRDAVRD